MPVAQRSIESTPDQPVLLVPPDPRLLRGGLAVNAVLSTTCATALIVGTETIGAHVGLPHGDLVGIGVSLLGFVGLLLWQVRRRMPHLAAALLTSLADLGWVLISAAYLASTELSVTGQLLVGGVAVGVGTAAMLQLAGLRRFLREPSDRLGTAHRYVWSMHANCAPEELWPVVSDLASISRYSAGLASSTLQPGPTRSAGAERHCTNVKGEAWAERVVGWEEGRAIDLEFAADAPGFPFPMRVLRGGWRLTDGSAPGGGTLVQVYWSFDLHRPWLAMMLVPLLAMQIESSFPAVIRAMVDDARTA